MYIDLSYAVHKQYEEQEAAGTPPTSYSPHTSLS